MRIKATISYSVLFEAPEGTKIEDIRAQALSQISEDFDGEETSLGTPCGIVDSIITRALPGIAATSSQTSIEIGVL